jgi:tRNA dimethylallyltransferase
MPQTAFPPAVFLMGPTAAGKSALAVKIAQQLGGEIVSVDSALVYRGMNIGTAKPGTNERGGIPHHLIDILDPAQNYSTAQFRTDALDSLDGIVRRDKLPILVGGTMLYFNALLHGLSELPAADAEIRRELEREAAQSGWAALHRRLATVDPEAAARIHPNDPQRIQRALEVFLLTGKPISELFCRQQNAALPYRALKLIVAPRDRKQLHANIERRFHTMLTQGFVDEVAALYGRGDLHARLPSLRAVGYRQIWGYLAGEYGFDTMCAKAVAATRQLAKRQFTWLRRETDAAAFASGEADCADNALRHLECLLTH